MVIVDDQYSVWRSKHDYLIMRGVSHRIEDADKMNLDVVEVHIGEWGFLAEIRPLGCAEQVMDQGNLTMVSARS